MAPTASLNSVLDASEVAAISEPIKNKLETYLERKQKTLDEVSANYERLRVDSEQKYFDLEKQLITSNGRLETETKSCSDIRERFAELELKYNDTAQRLREYETSHHGLSSVKGELELSNKQLVSEKDDLSELLERRNKEIDRLNDELNALTEKLAEANKAKCSIQINVDELQSQVVSGQYREKRYEQEKSLLDNQISCLNSELKEKSAQLINFRKEHSGRLVDVQSQLDARTDEVTNLKETVESFKKTNEDQATKIENYIQKLKELRDFQVVSEEQYRNEIAAQERLMSLYKVSSEEAESKVQELITAISELKRLLSEAIQAHTDLEAEKKESCTNFEAEIKERDEQIGRLMKELSNANELLEIARKKGTVPLSEQMIEEMSPSAAAASRLLKSGMTLTQIYSEYVEATENLQQEREDNAKLNQTLETIVQDIEEKTPILIKQREDYEQSLANINLMTGQLDTAMMECEKLRIAADEARRKSGQLTRDNHRLQQQSVDLGQQVKMLLKELEEARGHRVVTSHDDAEVTSSSEVSSSSRVISQKLVLFRDISELQEKNQHLLEVVRTLSEEREEQEKTLVDSKTAELQKQLETTRSEVEELQSARERQSQMVESIIRQRDMYRVLLQQTGSGPVPAVPSVTSTPMPAPAQEVTDHARSPDQKQAEQTNKTLEETKNALIELQEEFNLYRREKAENEKLISSTSDKFREETSELKLLNGKLASQLDFASERYKILQSNAEGYKKHISALQDKNQKISESVIKHDQTINTLKNELLSVQERASRAEVKFDHLRAECDLLKSGNQRLLQEKEMLHREQRTQNILLSNLNAIQNNLERADFEAKHKYNTHIATLQQENNSLKKKLETIEDSYKSKMADIENKLMESRQQIDADFEKQRKLQQELLGVNSTIDQLKQELSNAEAKFLAADERLSNIVQKQKDFNGGPSMEEENRALTERLGGAESENQALKKQLQEARRHVNQYKEIASSIEKNLQEQNQTSKHFKESTESKLQHATEEYERMKKQLEVSEKYASDMLNENIRVSEESHIMNADLRKQLMEVQNELQNITQRQEEALSNERIARDECQNQLKLAQECQEKYERELLLHAADVETLTKLKQEAESYNVSLAEVREEAHNAKEILELSQQSWEEQEKILKTDAGKLDKRCKDLTAQNTNLHAELEKMSEQMLAVQAKARETEATDSGATMTQPSIEEASKSPEHMIEVLRFLRREKEIAEARLEVIQAEQTRYRQKAEGLEKELEEVNRTLSEERQNNQVTLQTASEHAELMRKVENLNLLSDSNKLLRDEKSQLMQQLRETEFKARKLEDDLLPMRESGLQLTARADSLAAEKASLQAEVDRWKARTNHLIEQCNKADPEEQKRLVTEREELRKQLALSTEQNHKHRAEFSQLQHKFTVSQNEVTKSKQQITKCNEEISQLKTELESRLKDAEEKQKTIVQLRKIGRKYRLQAEETQKKLEETEAKMTAASSQNQTIALTEKLITVEKNLSDITERLAVSETERSSAQKHLQEQENRVKEWEEKVKVYESKVKEQESRVTEEESKVTERDAKITSLNEQIVKATEAIKKAQETETKLKEENADLDKKQTQSRNILQTAKGKLTSQKDQIEKLLTENSQLKEKVSNVEKNTAEESSLRSATIKSQYESRINKLEKELAEVKGRGGSQGDDPQQEKLQKENAELQQKVQHLQKVLENQQKQISVQQPKAKMPATPVERASSGQSETPPTANIRPMATPSGTSRQSASIQQGPSSRDATRAMASIRPMAVAPMPSAPTSQTPTATVMPTTVNVQDLSEGDSMSPAHSSSTPVRPCQQVQPVSPHIEEATPAPAVHETIRDTDTELQSEGATAEPPSRETRPVAPSAKRAREDDSREEKEKATGSPQVKRTKVIQEPADVATEITTELIEEEVVPVVTEITEQTDSQEFVESLDAETTAKDDSQGDASKSTDQSEESRSAETESQARRADDAEIEEETADNEQEDEDEEEESENRSGSEEYEVEEEDDDDDDDDDVIVVESGDDESQEYEEAEEDEDDEGQEEYEDEEAEEGMEEYEQEPDEEEEEGAEEEEESKEEEEYADTQTFPDEAGVEMEAETYDDVEAMQEGEEQASDDDEDVVIVDDEEENEAAMESQEEGVEQAETSGAQSTGQNLEVPQAQQPQLSRVPARTERLPSGGRTQQQLPPFVLGSQPGAFEEGDDSIVPSTPTLFVPRRNDDFAEAVSSPHVPPHARFVFGSGGEGGLQPELAQLGSQGGMDDTRMDLSQFEDGTGRSVPTTPLTSAPPIIITEAPPSEAESAPQTQEQQPPEIVISAAPSGDVPDNQQAESKVKPISEQSQQSTDSAEMTQEEKSELGQGEGDDNKDETGEASSDTQQKPGPSSGQDRTDSAGGSKPRIQRIVWDDSGAGSSGAQSQPITAPPTGQVQRGKAPVRGHIRGQPSARSRGQTAFRSRPMQYRGQPGRGTPPRGRGQRGGRAGMSRPPTF